MPFTLAHPLAVVPVYHLARRRLLLAALVIGSMVPDFSFIFPLPVSRLDSHSLAGTLLFGVPMGLGTWLIYVYALRPALFFLLPRAVQGRLPATSAPAWSWQYVLALVASLWLGALTHITWDAFTHHGGYFVARLPALQMELVRIGNYRLYGYGFAQHTSTLLGLVLLAVVLRRWLRRTPARVLPIEDPRMARLRWFVVAVILLCAGGAALITLWSGLMGAPSMRTVQVTVVRAVIHGCQAFTAALLLFTLAWHGWRYARGRIE